MGINLEIGAGCNPTPGYIHCDAYSDDRCPDALDFICDARSVPFPDGHCSNVLMFGVFEHFGIFEIKDVVKEVFRLLETGGVFRFDVPDFDWFVERYIHPELREPGRDEEWVLKSIFGGQDGPGQFHKWGWSEKRIRTFIDPFGFSRVRMTGRIWRNPEPNHLIWECTK